MSTGLVVPEGAMVVYQTGKVNYRDRVKSEDFPYLLEINLRPPEFMEMLFIGLNGGSEEFEFRATSAVPLREFITMNNVRQEGRLRRYIITGPEGVVESFAA